jgi:ABC-type glutathione transport system ATPase component
VAAIDGEHMHALASVQPSNSTAKQVPKSEMVFRARGLSKVYRMGEVEVHALRALDLDISRGEFVVLQGPSGSGKSTLLNILGGLDVPTSGEVTYCEHRLDGADENELTRFSARTRRLRVPVLQFDPQPYRARQSFDTVLLW